MQRRDVTPGDDLRRGRIAPIDAPRGADRDKGTPAARIPADASVGAMPSDGDGGDAEPCECRRYGAMANGPERCRAVGVPAMPSDGSAGDTERRRRGAMPSD